MSIEKKRSFTFKWNEKDLQSLYDLIGFSDKSGEFFGISMENYLKKLLLNNSSPQASDTIHSDVTTETDSLQKRAKSNPYLKEALDSVTKETEQSLEPPPCNYVSKSEKAGKVFCDNFRRTLKHVPVLFTLTTCQKCYERRQWVKEHRGEIPKQIEKVYCNDGGGLWIQPSRCLACPLPCEKAPITNIHLSPSEKFKREHVNDNPQGELDAQN